jgi:hypothetical protein
MRGRQRTRAAVVFFIACLVVLVPAGPASAGPYGAEPGGPGYIPDSTDHWFCFGSEIPGDQRFRHRDAMAYLDNATVMYDVESGACGSLTDVIFRQATPIPVPGIPPNVTVLGWAPCTNQGGAFGVVCEQGQVWIDPTAIFLAIGGFGAPVGMYDFQLAFNLRHESGHSAGMGHSGGVHALAQGVPPFNLGYLAYLPVDVCRVSNRFGFGC